MDITRFDDIVAGISASSTRRTVMRFLGLAVLGGGGLTLLNTEDGEAKRRKKKGKGKGKGNGNGGDSSCKGKCGGKCGRCPVGKPCSDRDECTTGLCKNGVCSEFVDPADCGVDDDGGMCATRTNSDNQKICTKINGRFFAEGTCADHCVGDEQCVLPGAGVECVLPCGA